MLFPHLKLLTPYWKGEVQSPWLRLQDSLGSNPCLLPHLPSNLPFYLVSAWAKVSGWIELAISYHCDSVSPSFLSSWKTPVGPLKPQGGISSLKPPLTILTEFITFPSVHFVHFGHCVFLSGLCEIFKVRERNLFVWAPTSRWGLGSHSSLLSSGMNQGQLTQTLILPPNLWLPEVSGPSLFS